MIGITTIAAAINCIFCAAKHSFKFLCLASIFCVFVVLPKQVGAESYRYNNAIVTEDLTWRGNITINGSLTVSPHATLRIEPGTIVQFISSGKKKLARMIVRGRIVAVGTPKNPITFTSSSGPWGGILLVSSTKNNRVEQSVFQYAESAIEARFSRLVTRNIQIVSSRVAFNLFDSIVTSNHDTISDADIGLNALGGELEISESIFRGCRIALSLDNSSLSLTESDISKSTEKGLFARYSRLKISNCKISENRVGIELNSCEGELLLSSLKNNSEIALDSSSSSLRVNRCRIVDNSGVGVRLGDNRITFWDTIISGNQKFNLEYKGSQEYSLPQIWWGTTDEAKINELVKSTGNGAISLYPWLSQEPFLP